MKLKSLLLVFIGTFAFQSFAEDKSACHSAVSGNNNSDNNKQADQVSGNNNSDNNSKQAGNNKQADQEVKVSTTALNIGAAFGVSAGLITGGAGGLVLTEALLADVVDYNTLQAITPVGVGLFGGAGGVAGVVAGIYLAKKDYLRNTASYRNTEDTLETAENSVEK